MSNLNRRNFLLSSGGALALVASGKAWTQEAPGQAALPSIYQPTRNIFVADSMSNFIVVIDLETGRRVASFDFAIRPHVMEVSRDRPMMAVGSPQASFMVMYDLKERKMTRVKLPSPAYQFFFVPQSNLMAIGMSDCVGMIDYSDFTLSVFKKRFDSPSRKTVLDSFYSLLFSAFSQSFYALEEEHPVIWRKRVNGMEDSEWDRLDFSKRIDTQRGFDVGVASPEDYLLTFTREDGNGGLIYFPEEDRLLSTGPMRTATNIYKPMLMPYIDNYTKNVMFGNKDGTMVHFDLEAGIDRPERFTVDFSPRIIRSGWLESTWVLGGDKALMFQSFKDPADRKIFRFSAEITNMWVTGDSKTVYVTIDEEAPQVIPYDIRTREKLKPIFTPGVLHAAIIRMGSNNSICY